MLKENKYKYWEDFEKWEYCKHRWNNWRNVKTKKMKCYFNIMAEDYNLKSCFFSVCFEI